MSDDTRIEVEGDEAFRLSMARVASQLDHLDRAGQIGGAAIRNRAMSAAPVRTGALVRSIRADTTGSEITVGAYVRYAAFQEFGTVHVPASPYLHPALQASEKEIVNAYTGEVEQLLGSVKGA